MLLSAPQDWDVLVLCACFLCRAVAVPSPVHKNQPLRCTGGLREVRNHEQVWLHATSVLQKSRGFWLISCSVPFFCAKFKSAFVYINISRCICLYRESLGKAQPGFLSPLLVVRWRGAVGRQCGRCSDPKKPQKRLCFLKEALALWDRH